MDFFTLQYISCNKRYESLIMSHKKLHIIKRVHRGVSLLLTCYFNEACYSLGLVVPVFIWNRFIGSLSRRL